MEPVYRLPCGTRRSRVWPVLRECPQGSLTGGLSHQGLGWPRRASQEQGSCSSLSSMSPVTSARSGTVWAETAQSWLIPYSLPPRNSETVTSRVGIQPLEGNCTLVTDLSESCRSPPLSAGGHVPTPQWMPQTTERTKLSICYVVSNSHIIHPYDKV